ncbi:MAG: hypothetical protein QOH24_2055 [Verrucomicrobiota bacterium]
MEMIAYRLHYARNRGWLDLLLCLDFVGQEALLTDNIHLGQRAANGVRKEHGIDSSKGGRFAAAKEKRCNGEVELIDETKFQKGAEQSGPALTSEALHTVIFAELLQHPAQIEHR